MNAVVSKHHGLGNDFLVWNLEQGTPQTPWPEIARQLCDRNTGIGADGLLLLGIVDSSNLTMRLYNSDGSIAEMSGNGIRCLVQAAHFTMGNGAGAVYAVLTDGGPRTATVVGDRDGPTVQVSVEMGPVTELNEPVGWAALECDPMRPVAHLSLGNPHSVVGVDDVAAVDLKRLGELVPQVNLEIVEHGPGTNGITMRVHERGAGITRACGTGACAAASAALAWGLVPASAEEVVVHMDGGTARVMISADRHATLLGPSTHIAQCTVSV